MAIAHSSTMRTIIIVVTFCGGFALLGNGLWLQAKALLAQVLIADAWQNSLRTQQTQKPWQWADTWPVAKLYFPQQYQQRPLYVLEGIQGNALAFGPGHMINTALPGQHGVSVIGGHRDTHFSVLQHLKHGDNITVVNQQGNHIVYHIDALQVEDSQYQQLSVNNNPTTHNTNTLILVTCYPFNALQAGGSLRYVVYASQVQEGSDLNLAVL